MYPGIIIQNEARHQLGDVINSYDLLALINLIENTVLSHTEEQYHFTIVHKQELSFYDFQQNTLTSNQWYERFNTKVDFGNAIGVTRQHEVLLKCTSRKFHRKEFYALQDAKKEKIGADAKVRYLAYNFLKQSARTGNKLRTNLSDNYTMGEKNHVTRQENFRYSEKHSKTIVRAQTDPEGSLFAQRGVGGYGRYKDTFEN